MVLQLITLIQNIENPYKFWKELASVPSRISCEMSETIRNGDRLILLKWIFSLNSYTDYEMP